MIHTLVCRMEGQFDYFDIEFIYSLLYLAKRYLQSYNIRNTHNKSIHEIDIYTEDTSKKKKEKKNKK